MKNYWHEIKNQLKFYDDRVFYLPLDDLYLRKIESQIGISFPEIYFEFLREFGFTQDFIPELTQTEESLIEDLAYTRECCPDFFPISTHEEADEVWLLKRDSSDDFNLIIDLLNKKLSTRWLDRKWKNKYQPNIFGTEIALFEIDGKKIIIEREDDDDEIVYFFEMEEPVLEIKKLNKTQIIKDILDSNDIDYELFDYGLIEIEE